MLNALRAFVMILIFVGTAHAGEGLIPPAPAKLPTSTGQEAPSGETLDAGTATPEVNAAMVFASLQMLAILPALV